MASDSDQQGVRKQAEERVRREFPADEATDSPLVYELRVHQVELEMQMDELKRTQDELLASRRQYESLFEYAPIGYFVLNKSGVVRDANYYAAGLLHADRQYLTGKPFIIFVPRDSHSLFFTHLQTVFESQRQQSVELKVLTRTGDVIWTRIESRVQNSEPGGQHCLVAVADITDRKKTEDALIIAKDDAIKANKIKTVFLANMSHEIRTPMNGILAMSELLNEMNLPEEALRYSEAIHSSAHSLLGIINDILDFSRIEENRIDLTTERFSIQSVVGPTMDLFESLAREKDIAISYEIDTGLADAYEGDPVRIRQILYNLVGNAVKFTEEGRVDVQITARPLSGFLHELTFAVRDTGPGIPAEQREVIFESFTQGEAGYRRKYPGTGLGLAISRSLAKLMGGQLYFESESDKGSTFYFSVPLHLANAAPDQNPGPAGRVTQVLKLEGRVLIAEDNAINTLVLQTILEKAGLMVDTAYNGREALDSLARERYDAVFMDISMPEMDGVEATRQIRSGERSGVNADIPVIAITAHAMQGDREAFLKQGMTAYIGKPFTRDGVLKVLEPILAGDHA